MTIRVDIAGKEYAVESESGRSIAIPLLFNGAQPNSYDVPKATAQAYEADGFVGDTRRGSGCNFETYSLTPHCNGTHTECVGHITLDRIAVSQILNNILMPATLITVAPQPPDGQESYSPELGENDRVITRKKLEAEISNEKGFLEALIIRTLPNDPSKVSRRYMQEMPPFFTNEAMRYLVSLGIRHLLVDLPSLDRTFDEGKLSNHHIFFELPGKTAGKQVSPKTVTEMIYVPEEVSDGSYLLNLQIPAFISDAAPSRPIIFPVL